MSKNEAKTTVETGQAGNVAPVVIEKDTVKIARLTAALEKMCGLVNCILGKLNDEGLLCIEVTTDIARQVCKGDPTKIIEAAREAIRKESAGFATKYTRLKHERESEEAARRIMGIFKELQEAKEKARFELSAYSFTSVELSLYITVECGGVVSFDRLQVERDCTKCADADAQAFMEEARRIHAAMVEFDRKCRALSGNSITGITDSEEDKQSIISVIDGKIWLDFSAVDALDFTNAEEVLNNPKRTYDVARFAPNAIKPQQ